MTTNNNQLVIEDVYTAYLNTADKLFTGIKHSVPQYHQSITNVQQEYLHACENFINTSIKLQQEYAKKTGITTKIPEVTQQMIQATTEDFIKSISTQNKLFLATIDATQQNIKTFDYTTKSFVNLLESWFSTFVTKK